MIQAVPTIGQPATLPLHLIRAEEQIRTRNGFDEASLRGLAETIKEHGLIQPIVVRPGDNGEYIVVAGERRMLASSMAGLTDVPVLIRDPGFIQDTLAVQAIENLQRESLTLADTAIGVAELVKHYGSAKAAAVSLGKSPGWVSKHVSLTKVHPDTRAVLLAGHTDDLEVIFSLNQLRKVKSEKALATFKFLAEGLETGRTTRADIRKALEKFKAPSPADAETEEEEQGATEEKTGSSSLTLKLPAELAVKLDLLGGKDWLISQIRDAKP